MVWCAGEIIPVRPVAKRLVAGQSASAQRGHTFGFDLIAATVAQDGRIGHNKWSIFTKGDFGIRHRRSSSAIDLRKAYTEPVCAPPKKVPAPHGWRGGQLPPNGGISLHLSFQMERSTSKWRYQWTTASSGFGRLDRLTRSPTNSPSAPTEIETTSPSFTRSPVKACPRSTAPTEKPARS